MTENIFPDRGGAGIEDRTDLTGVRPRVFWFFGLSGSGKSAIARNVETELLKMGKPCYRLDGDNLRSGLCSDLGFSHEDRAENIRRAANAAGLIADAGIVVIATFITPLENNRAKAREILGDLYSGIYVKCSIETCRSRDPKGLYKKADSGEIPEFTGVSSPFEEPDDDSYIIDTDKLSERESAAKALDYILERI